MLPTYGRARLALFGLAVVLLATPAQALVNQPKPFVLDYGYGPGFTADAAQTYISGAMHATPAPSAGPWGFINVTGAGIGGLTSACINLACFDDPAGNLRIDVADGGSIAFELPSGATASAAVDADHAFAMLLDFRDDRSLAEFGLGKSLVSAALGGEARFTALGAVPGDARDPSRSGIAVGLRDDAVLTLRRGDQQVQQVVGNGHAIVFAGSPAVAPFAYEVAVLPFAQGTATFTQAAGDVTAAAIDLERLRTLPSKLDEADQDPEQEAPGDDELALQQELLAPVLDGAVLHQPGPGGNVSGFALVRFTRLDVTADGSGLSWTGRTPFAVQESRVQNARQLVGVWYIQLPWWAAVLLAVAVAMSIANVVLKRPKTHATWDKHKWVGLVAGLLAVIVFVVLWDIEFRSVLGVSVFSAGLSGKARGMVALLELAPLVLVAGGIIAPIRMLLKAGARMAGQGRFMNLATPVAYLLGFALGAMYLLSYLDLLVGRVIGQAF